MVDVYEYLLTPKFEHIVKGVTKYKNYDERKPPFNLVRVFQSVEIELSTYAPLDVAEITNDCESIWKTLHDRYHCYFVTTFKGYCNIDFSYDMPEDVKDKLRENPDYDLEEELGWYNNFHYWNDGSDGSDVSESEIPEEKWFDDVWAYTPFSVSFIRHKPPPPRPPTPPPRPENPYEHMLGPLEEIHL